MQPSPFTSYKCNIYPSINQPETYVLGYLPITILIEKFEGSLGLCLFSTEFLPRQPGVQVLVIGREKFLHIFPGESSIIIFTIRNVPTW